MSVRSSATRNRQPPSNPASKRGRPNHALNPSYKRPLLYLPFSSSSVDQGYANASSYDNGSISPPLPKRILLSALLVCKTLRLLPLATTDVQPQARREDLSSGIQALSIPEQIELQLDQKLAALDPATSSRSGQQHFSQVSAWLETTQWTRYFHGHGLLQAAALIEIPSTTATRQAALGEQGRQSEYQLSLLLDSFDRVIEQARKSLLEDRVNVFDQHRVNSFIPRRSHSRPLWHKLKEPTYRTYKKVWKQLLCFLYRLVWQKQAPVLYFRLTSAQLTSLEAALRAAASLAHQHESAESEDLDLE
ncbi:hypothetical protein BDZ45DRAFT_697001 [Acephala macrosclerotiorum]|nr:hypothetical protein BDZ45DRAFT_697001 [Acephala macrosclerotiorum]